MPLNSCFTASSNSHLREKVLNSSLTYICAWYHGWRASTAHTAGWCAYISPISLPKCGLWSRHQHHPRNLLGEAKCETLLQISCIKILANNDTYYSRTRVPLEGSFLPGSLLTTGVENLKNHSCRLAFQFLLTWQLGLTCVLANILRTTLGVLYIHYYCVVLPTLWVSPLTLVC